MAANTTTGIGWWQGVRLAMTALTVAAALAACGTGPAGIAVVANTQQTLSPGPNRILMAVSSEKDGSLVPLPDTPTTATFSKDGESDIEVPTRWIWGIPDARGFLVANVDLPSAGRWNVVLRPDGMSATRSTPFAVQDSSPVPSIGDRAIAARTPTYPDTPLASLSSDPNPDPRLYAMSLDDALGDGIPTVITFATPAYCTSALCGPTLDVVRAVMPEFPDLDFVHVEVYDLAAAAGGSLEAVPAVEAWNLPSEPWVFVVDAGGIVTARFEGALGADELRSALSDLP